MKKILCDVVCVSYNWYCGIHLQTKSRILTQKFYLHFKKEFSFAKDVKWEVKGELIQVNFSLNDHGFIAWYNSDAELISTARNLLYMQLPLSSY